MPHHRRFVVEQERRESLGQLGLADAGRAKEHEGADRPVGILQTGARPANGRCDGGDRFFLPHHAPREFLFHFKSLSRSPSSILSTGTPVQRETTWAIWSGVTASSKRTSPDFASVSANLRSSSGMHGIGQTSGFRVIALALRNRQFVAGCFQAAP